jgi:hypothetical protein
MALWCIRYADRFGRPHSMFHSQEFQPSVVAALGIVRKSISEAAKADGGGARSLDLSSIKVLEVSEVGR